MFVAVGRGVILGQAASRAAICSNITFTGTAHAPNATACTAAGAAGSAGGGGGVGGTAPGTGLNAGC